MATNLKLDGLDRKYEIYTLKKQLDSLFLRFFDPETGESRRPSEIEEMLEESGELLNDTRLGKRLASAGITE